MTLKGDADDVIGGGFAEVRDGETIAPVIRPPQDALPDGDKPGDE